MLAEWQEVMPAMSLKARAGVSERGYGSRKCGMESATVSVTESVTESVRV